MKAQSPTATGRQRPMAKAFALAALGLFLTMSIVTQSYGAAMAPDIDPKRYRVGNMVYPPGVKPPEADTAQKPAKSAKGKKSRATTIQPKPKHTVTGKENSDD